MINSYIFSEVELKWQNKWEQSGIFKVSQNLEELHKKPKYYILDMFPYPSGSGLHVGHPEGYTATDVIARIKRMQGFNVLHPMGWDAFGLPTERAAVRENTHPAIITKRNIGNFKKQIKRLGFSYDWSREIDTSNPDYYKWTQWIFLKLYKKGLAYLENVEVNWCQKLGTVLANEEIKDNKYIETGDPVERRVMRQWMLRITAYAERLLVDLDDVDWPENVKEMQRNWIGKSVKYEIDLQIENQDEKLKIYTANPEAINGCTFCVISSKHHLIEKLNLERFKMLKLDSKNFGYFTGKYVIHPVNKKRLPLWCADYINEIDEMAIMAVPKINKKDNIFAKLHNLPIIDYEIINKIDYVGIEKVNYRLRDWLFSRQRYWGEPFPVLILSDDTIKILNEEELPVLLPAIDEYRSTGNCEPPLARATKDWLEVLQTDGTIAKRETNTMPQWAGSCWYYLRYLDPNNSFNLCNSEIEKYWMPVDLYIGGVEHAVLHLLYARFWHKVLYDCGVVSTKEPFKKLFNQGMILSNSYQDENGKYYFPEQVSQIGQNYYIKENNKIVKTQIEKMSKSRYNVINPDEVIDKYGADAMRLYELFMGPLDQVKQWETSGLEGVYRFIQRVWRMSLRNLSNINGKSCPKLWKTLNKTIKFSSERTIELKFNTVIAQLMIFVNEATSAPILPREILCTFIKILSPYAPHIAEEIWEKLGNDGFVANAEWPKFDEDQCIESEITIVVQINGKKRAEFLTSRGQTEEMIKSQALELDKIKILSQEGQIKKIIIIQDKIINFIT